MTNGTKYIHSGLQGVEQAQNYLRPKINKEL